MQYERKACPASTSGKRPNSVSIWQQVNGLYIPSTNAGLKRIDYEYDLISGKVNFVRYQDGQPDRFYYLYSYDADNRLTNAWSGIRAMVDTTIHSVLQPGYNKLDAKYYYYLHGPLARMELGDTIGRVQGVDYAYTLQGWMKGTNSSIVQSSKDMGRDSLRVARDAYGYSLYYYGNNADTADYASISGLTPFTTSPAGLSTFRALYNGNIAAVSTNIPKLTDPWHYYTYHYDQLNRVTLSSVYKNSGSTSTAVKDYMERFSFDPNGNIKTASRYMGAATIMDSLAYNYNTASGRLTNNRLNYITDAVATHTYPYGLDNQSVNNYTYDATGNMLTDVVDTISNITWTVYGKIQGLTNSKGSIAYSYDPAGQRATKMVSGITTYYIRDAQGNTLAVYDNTHSVVNWREQDRYGSSRLGMWLPNIALASGNSVAAWDTTGKTQNELTNHLGNVMVTITDKRLQHTTNGTTVDYFTPDISTAQEYYAFGGLMAGRNYTYSKPFRYGFNGKEDDNDVKGVGSQQNYGTRIYDPRTVKFYSLDPLGNRYPYYTPYSFAGNNPISNLDIDGEEEYHYTMTLDNQGKTHLKLNSTENNNHHNILGFKFDTEIQGQRYVVQYNNNTYYIGFASNPGRSNNFKQAKFKQFLKGPDANVFVKTFDDSKTENANAFTQDMQIGALASLWVYDNIRESQQSVTKNENVTPTSDNLALNTRKFNPAKPALMREDLDIKSSTNGNAPDFEGTPYLYQVEAGQKNIVQIKLTGSYSADFAAANEAAGLSGTPKGYVWHHLDDFDSSSGISTLQLVRSDIHTATIPHSGSVKQYETTNEVKYKP